MTDPLQLLYGIPIYFQVAERETVAQAGSRIVPVVIGNALGTILSGRLISKTKRYKFLTAFANSIAFVGFLLMLLRWHGSTNWAESLYVSLPGVGMGIIQSATFIHLAASVDHSEMAIAGTTWFLAQNIGSLIGASISTSLINSVIKMSLQKSLAGFDDHDKVGLLRLCPRSTRNDDLDHSPRHVKRGQHSSVAGEHKTDRH